MRTNSRRRGRGLALAVIAVSASLPQMAWAQQNGLFPLHPIKRHRVPCDHEDPIYKINKYQYFGAFPTCWHRFPDGWGCPSADAPDREKSFKETPLGSREDGELEAPPEEGPGMENPPPPRPRPNLPAVPGGERSPFDTPPAAPGAAAPGATTPPRTPPATDPFASPDLGGGAAPRNNAPKPPAAANPPGGDAPDPAPGSDQPGRNPSPRARRDDGGDRMGADETDGPVLALPNITLPPIGDAGSVYEPPPTQMANSGNPVSGGNSSSTPRRGLLSGFFSNLGINWIRR